MTVSSTVNSELTVGEISLQAFQLAGLKSLTQSLTTAEQKLATNLLETILDELSIYGVQARMRGFVEVTMVSGTYVYSLGADDLDVIEDGAYMDATVTDTSKAASETVIAQRDQETWHRISAKSATGKPTIFWVDRSATTLQVRLWPIPDEAGTCRFMTQKHLADVDATTVTLDLQTYWTQYIIWELAHQSAESQSMPGSKCERLSKRASAKLRRARSFANQRTPW